MPAPELDALRIFLRLLPPGPVVDPAEVVGALKTAWGELEVAEEISMATDTGRRLEGLSWEPPMLTFDMERHDATVWGSSPVEFQPWVVNVEAGTAEVGRKIPRQMTALDRRIDVKPLVDEIASLILTGEDDARLSWSSDRQSVKVKIGLVIPNVGYQHATTGRRQRFWAALEPALTANGWEDDREQPFPEKVLVGS